MQFIDLKAQYRILKDSINDGIQTVLEHGQFIMGPEVHQLEERLASYIGVKHCITCGNGTDALQILYMAYGIGQGDVVFAPDITFIATVEPACMLGAQPVFCDVEKGSYNLCPDNLERQIKKVLTDGHLLPKAVIAVDFLGCPANYEKLESICKQYGLLLIEDAAQSFGASRKGKRCGSFGDAAITSFFPAKPLGCYGDGGAIFTDNDELAAVCRSIAVHGKGTAGKYNNVRIGANSRLDTLQAAILLPKLEALEKFEIDARQRVAGRYNEAFASDFTLLSVEPGSVSAYAQYALLAADKNQRDSIIDKLTKKKIPNMVYYPKPQHMLPVFAEMEQYGEPFENAKEYCDRTFSLPMHPYLEQSEQDQIIAAVRESI